jgi:hypothetical protein
MVTDQAYELVDVEWDEDLSPARKIVNQFIESGKPIAGIKGERSFLISVKRMIRGDKVFKDQIEYQMRGDILKLRRKDLVQNGEQ